MSLLYKICFIRELVLPANPLDFAEPHTNYQRTMRKLYQKMRIKSKTKSLPYISIAEARGFTAIAGKIKIFPVLIGLLFTVIFNITLNFVFPAPALALKLAAGSFKSGGVIPAIYTCEGSNLSPSLSWTNVPAGTKTFAVIMKDIDAPGGIFYHWLIYNIPGNARSLKEDISPSYRTVNGFYAQGINGFGNIGYGGPCPPQGKPHRYFITLFALSVKLKLGRGANAGGILSAMKGRILDSVSVTGYFGS